MTDEATERARRLVDSWLSEPGNLQYALRYVKEPARAVLVSEAEAEFRAYAAEREAAVVDACALNLEAGQHKGTNLTAAEEQWNYCCRTRAKVIRALKPDGAKLLEEVKRQARIEGAHSRKVFQGILEAERRRVAEEICEQLDERVGMARQSDNTPVANQLEYEIYAIRKQFKLEEK